MRPNETTGSGNEKFKVALRVFDVFPCPAST